MRPRRDRGCPVIDLFAGPGGLGEGFSAFGRASGDHPFRIAISVEKDAWAHQTLELRAFFRQFKAGDVPVHYYDHLAGRISRQELYSKHPSEAAMAQAEAFHAEIGLSERQPLMERIVRQLHRQSECVLIGGPPCQAYSVAGRSRNKGVVGYRAEDDHRQFLYREYLRTIVHHWPMVFVMENVPGLLSATLEDGAIFERVLEDLRSPGKAVHGRGSRSRAHWYDVVALHPHGSSAREGRGFIVKSEEHGIPQARHRLILLGIRDDLRISVLPADAQLKPQEEVSARQVLAGLPKLRSGLSRGADGNDAWLDVFRAATNSRLAASARRIAGAGVAKTISRTIAGIAIPKANRGGEFIPSVDCLAKWREDWFTDPKLSGICNHSSREHMPSDLLRYLYASSFALNKHVSPRLRDFPLELLPAHENVQLALNHHGYFQDRFRVQLWDRPSTTVTSHIAKDGPSFIHPDPSQCRSLTVREAARLQTFPDNYFFCGPRTEQYKQVGNAVPPLLALQVAECVWKVLLKAGVV